MNHSKSEQAWQQAQAALAGGVNSPVRAFNSVGGAPIFIASAKGSRLTDVDGNSYIDYVGSWGPALLGHADKRIVAAVAQQAQRGLSFGAPTSLETEIAQEVERLMPSIERIRFTSSGTEACMSAIRLARGHTERQLIVCFAGCYHGHADAFLGNAGSGLLSLNIREAAGVPPDFSRHTLSLPYNDIATLNEVFERRGEEIAAVIVEPIAANMNLVMPVPGFLEAILDLCRRHRAVSIFDEVITGFRVDPGGSQALFGLRPDLTILGKVLGGGLPVGAYGGKEGIMSSLAPTGKVYQAGTLSGNPLAMRAGLETLRILSGEGLIPQATARTERLAAGINQAAEQAGVQILAHSVGPLLGLHCLPAFAQSLEGIVQAPHPEIYKSLFHAMLDQGIYMAPSPFEATFVSAAHSDADIEETCRCLERSCQQLVG